jgi:putative heme-binding domain-containing protein
MIKRLFVLAPGVALCALVVATAAPLRAQQHSYTPAEIEEGRKLYDANCGRCHNETGDGVTGVELFKQFRRATSDEDVAKIIREGIPGTSMPSHAFLTSTQALNVVAFLRSMVGVTPAARSSATTAGAPGRGAAAIAGGDAARGKTLFEGKGGCTGCHRVRGNGGQTGPDLSAIGQVRPARGFDPGSPNLPQIERAILDPSADIAPSYRVFQVVARTGTTTRGTLLNQDTFSIQMLDSTQNLRSFMKADLREFGFVPSPMPSYEGKLTSQELADLLVYLLSLRG